MTKEKEGNCPSPITEPGCCRVEALVSVDERGQVVLPKELREKADIKAGDKLAVASWNCGNKIYCLFVLKAEDLASMVKNMLGPVMSEIAK